ncbi:MAG: acyl carrier protein, partial [Pseudobutyrivibrio sp.]|nr:acyl carrier protein [Pseudobutyrivibrio sp.]
DVAEWDSLENINIVMACERQWNIKFDLNEIAEMKNVGKMIDVIASKLA